jgi:hypothetical protein
MRAALPTRGTLSFDVVSQAPPPAPGAAAGDAKLLALLRDEVGVV